MDPIESINAVIDWVIDNPGATSNDPKTLDELNTLRTRMEFHIEEYKDYVQMPSARK